MNATVEEEVTISRRAMSQMIGHTHVFATFEACESAGKLPHGWILSGPTGIGKVRVAFAMAEKVLAKNDPAARDLIAAGSHPDLHHIASEGQKEIPVAAIRSVVEAMQKTPARGGYRVVVIDGAQKLNRHASNALLKLLEEPLPNSLIILTTSSDKQLLETLCSRCVKLPLHPLSYEELFLVLEAQGAGLGGVHLKRWYALAGGRPGFILQCQDYDLASDYELCMQFWNQKLPLNARLQPILKRFGSVRHSDEEVYLRLMLKHSLASIVWCLQGVDLSQPILEDEMERLDTLRTQFPLASWLKMWEKLLGVYERADATHMTLEQYLYQIHV